MLCLKEKQCIIIYVINKNFDIHFNSMLLVKEMQKRCINVEHLKDTKTLIARYKEHEEIIDDIDLGLMSAPLRYTLDNKWATKQLLQKFKISVAKGQVFKTTEFEKAKKFAEKNLPVVIKPVTGCHGYGVRPHIDSMKEFEVEFKELIKFLETAQPILIEEHFEGAEFRLTATKNGFFAAIHRTPPKVVGDGKRSIQELIDRENINRIKNRKNCLEMIWQQDGEVDRYLAKKKINVNYVPKQNEIVHLRFNTNVCTGADCIDVTDFVHPFYKKITFEILKKIKGLPYAGIDLITEDISEYNSKTKYVICEINPSPGISLHTHPGSGTPRDLPKALIDLIFPETAKNKSSNV